MLAIGRGFGVFAVVVLALLWPAVALAVPANDNFADAEVLSGLPIEVERSNLEATKESGEPWFAFASGHSVWFEWEATGSGWVTVSGCSPDFTAQIAIFQGDSLGFLARVAEGNASEGPYFCASGSGGVLTFWAESGEAYAIVEDSSGFYFPEWSPPPVTEGDFTLRIEETPPPPNDAFANASVIDGEISEEPNGTRRYFATARGYTWDAGKEVGEPDHGGDPGGASVWYSWVAPESGSMGVSSCCSGPELISVYQGGSLATLSPVAAVGSPLPAYPVQAGQTYWIAVDGAYDDGAGAAEVGSFSLLLGMSLAPGPGERPPPPVQPPAVNPLPPGDTEPPRTTIRRRAVKPGKGTAVFRFASSERGGSFRCRLDGKRFRACKSPARLARLGAGKHVFRVVAVDAAGNADPTPAVARFGIGRSAAG